ncbi:hypothetical protein [Streptomyces sp. NPDC054975]
MPSTPEPAAALLMGLLRAVGDGCHTLTVSVTGCARGAVCILPFRNVGEYTGVDAAAAFDVIALLALTSGGIGGAVVRTNHADNTSRVLGWRLSDCTAHPLGRAEIFNAYCTDAAAGELIPPEPGVEYADAPLVEA